MYPIFLLIAALGFVRLKFIDACTGLECKNQIVKENLLQGSKTDEWWSIQPNALGWIICLIISYFIL